MSPLTKRAREILDEIRREKRSGAIIPNVNGLVFTKEDGEPITKGMINEQIEGCEKDESQEVRFPQLPEHRVDRMGAPRDPCRRGDEGNRA